MDVVSVLFEHDSEPSELLRDYSQIAIGCVSDGDGAAGERGHAYERAHFDHVRKDRVDRPAEPVHPMDGQQIGSYAFYSCAHGGQHAAELLDVGLAGGVVDCGRALGQSGGHQNVGRSCHRGLVEQHVFTFKAIRGRQSIGLAFMVIFV